MSQAWLTKLMEVPRTVPEKRNRNIFLSRLVLAMQTGELEKPFLKPPPVGPLPNAFQIFGPPQPEIEVGGSDCRRWVRWSWTDESRFRSPEAGRKSATSTRHTSPRTVARTWPPSPWGRAWARSRTWACPWPTCPSGRVAAPATPTTSSTRTSTPPRGPPSP